MNYLSGKSKKRSPPLLGGSSHDLQVVSNHGDRKSPRLGLRDPFQMAFLWLINGGYELFIY